MVFQHIYDRNIKEMRTFLTKKSGVSSTFLTVLTEHELAPNRQKPI